MLNFMKLASLLLVGICAADTVSTNTSQIPLTVTLSQDFLTWKTNTSLWDNSKFQYLVLETGCTQTGEPCTTRKSQKISYDLPQWIAFFPDMDSGSMYQLSLCEVATCDTDMHHGRIATFDHNTLYFVEISSEFHNQMYQFPPNQAPWYSKLDFGSGDTVGETKAVNAGVALTSTCTPAASCQNGAIISQSAVPKAINLNVGISAPSSSSSLTFVETSTSQIPLTVTLSKDFLTWKSKPLTTGGPALWDNSKFQWLVLETGCTRTGEPCTTRSPRKINYDLPQWFASFPMDSGSMYQLSLCETATCDTNKHHGRIANFDHNTFYFVEISSELHNQMYQFPPNKAPWYSKLDFGSGDTVGETKAVNNGVALTSTCTPAANCANGAIVSQSAVPKAINLYVGKSAPSLILIV